MDDDEPYAVQAMLHHLYTLEYPCEVLHSLFRQSMGPSYFNNVIPRPLEAQKILWGFDLAVFSIANKYGLTDLANEAEQRFSEDQVEITREYEGFVYFMRRLYQLGETTEMLAIRKKVVKIYDLELAKALDEALIMELVERIPDLATDVIKSLAVRIRR